MSTRDDDVRRRVADPGRLAAVRASGLLDTPAEEPFDRLARLAAATLDAPLAFVTVVDERRSFWKACIGVDAQGPADRQNAVEESFCQYVVALDAELVVGDAASDPRTRDNPSIDAMGVAAWAGFPLRSPGGEVLGSFCVVDTKVRTWSERDVEVLRTLAHAASGEVALRAAAEQSAALARTLQDALLPPITPAVPGLDVGASFRAAGRGSEVLGDFYDVFESADGRWNAVLGDVCGKGIAAARLTALSRFTVRAGAIRERRPSRVLMLLNEALLLNAPGGDGADRFVTAVLAALDPDGQGFVASVSSAGHVPALVRRGDVCEPVAGRGALLGAFDDILLQDVEVPLGPGDLLVLFTDGVTEARDARGEQYGVDRLTEAVARAPGDAATLAASITDAATAFAGDDPQDDMAVLVLAVTAQTTA